MVDVEALLYRLFVVVGATALFASLDETGHQFVLWHVELYHRSHRVSALGKHRLQGFCLRDGAGESVEDHTCVLLAEAVVDAGEDAYHELVGDELPLVDIAFGGLTKFCSVLYLGTQHVAGGDVPETIFLNQLVALGAFS